jgi:hypothetical protein
VGVGAAAEVHASRLSARAALHITSLPADLSILMCNLARIPAAVATAAESPRAAIAAAGPARERRAAVVLDPFCGTGSILLAAALLARAATDDDDACASAVLASGREGAAGGGGGGSGGGLECVGIDIEAASKPAVLLNFEQLGLAGDGVSVRVLRADVTACVADLAATALPLASADAAAAAATARPPLAPAEGSGEPPPLAHGSVDAIVTDPPYGNMVLGKGALAYAPSAERDAGWRRLAAGEELSALAPLLALGALALRAGGRLVFLAPAPVSVRDVSELLPADFCDGADVAGGGGGRLRIESAVRMPFTAKQDRWLVQMRREALG